MKAFKYILLAFALITPVVLPAVQAQDKPKGEGKGMRPDRLNLHAANSDTQLAGIA